MIKFLGQIMKIPMAVLASGMEMMARTMKEIQRSFENNIDVASDGLAQTLSDMADGGATASVVAEKRGDGAVDTPQQTGNKEEDDMGDQDLSGDDVKVVRYRIIFTKRDFEAVLDKAEEELVDYPTDGGSLGGIKVAEFMSKVQSDAINLPAEWRGKEYPTRNAPRRGWRIPRDDWRYIQFIYEVVRRIERQEAQYDKDQVKVLRQIRDEIAKRP
jgi:hypothetical protein